MKIWVDADACPVVIKEILFRAAERTQVPLTLVANQPLQTPNSDYIDTLQVPRGFDVADDEIVKRLTPGDLVITSDIPLAAEVIDNGGHALSPRGELHTTENIRARLNMRDFLDTMRASGVDTGGPPALSQRDRQQFANTLDRFLTQHVKLKRILEANLPGFARPGDVGGKTDEACRKEPLYIFLIEQIGDVQARRPSIILERET